MHIPRRLTSGLLRPLLAALGAVLLLAAMAQASSSPSPTKWRGTHKPCKVSLRDTSDYRDVPLPLKQEGHYVFHWVVQGYVDWNDPHYPNRGSLSFQTCPPKRILIVGDSLAFSFGIPMMNEETDYGTQLGNSAVLGCTFGDKGYFINRQDRPQPLPPGCPDAFQHWGKVVNEYHAKLVIVELGYRSEFDYVWNGKTVHLGESQFDSFVHSQIESLITTLSQNGRKILFLSVPYVAPMNRPDGSPEPSSSTTRHREINSMIKSVVAQHKSNVSMLDIDKIVSPGNHYDADVNGKLCRWDGVHFTRYCAWLMEPAVLGAARQLLAR